MAEKNVALDNKALLEAMTAQFQFQRNEITAIKGTLDSILSTVNQLSAKGKARSGAATSTAGGAAPAAKAPAFPKTPKQWFARLYKEHEEERAPFADLLSEIRVMKAYTSAKSSEKLTKEAMLIWDKLAERTDKDSVIASLTSRFAAEREEIKKKNGHITEPESAPAATTVPAAAAAPAAAASSLTAAATAVTKTARKPRAAPAKPKKAANAAPAVPTSAALAASASKMTADDEADEDEDQDT